MSNEDLVRQLDVGASPKQAILEQCEKYNYSLSLATQIFAAFNLKHVVQVQSNKPPYYGHGFEEKSLFNCNFSRIFLPLVRVTIGVAKLAISGHATVGRLVLKVWVRRGERDPGKI